MLAWKLCPACLTRIVTLPQRSVVISLLKSQSSPSSLTTVFSLTPFQSISLR